MGRGLRGMNYKSVSICLVATKKMRNLHLHSSWINSVFDQVKFQQVLLRRFSETQHDAGTISAQSFRSLVD